ncbi:MAG: cupin-like domain-containing protein [Proteobacteria bacterium]|nr:cupin-like domain-containing protein [Pseudomonadota bacterium]
MQEDLQRLVRHLLALDGYAGASVDTLSDFTAESFYHSYVFRNRPALLEGLVATWPAIKLWTFEYMMAQAGDMEVGVSVGRDRETDYEANYRRHEKLIPFRSLLELAASGVKSNDTYLVAKGDFFRRAHSRALCEDIPPPMALLSALTKPDDGSLWLGPAGTITPLHQDSVNVLLCQVRGQKEVSLISSLASPWLAPTGLSLSDFDPDRPDYCAFSVLREARIYRTVLSPGDALFIPVGWWHKVSALSASISVSYTTFRLPKLPPL